MKYGYITISNELIDSPDWFLIKAELDKVFKVQTAVAAPANTTIYIGCSDLFEDIPEGGNAIQYQCIFMTVKGKPKFTSFEKVK